MTKYAKQLQQLHLDRGKENIAEYLNEVDFALLKVGTETVKQGKYFYMIVETGVFSAFL